MKWMIASDLHGSAYYCRLLLERLAQEAPDRLVLLGDLLYHGPRNDLPRDYDTKAVAAMLNGIADRLLCVRGNCDTEVDQMVLDFPVLADYAVLADREVVYLTHGHRFNGNAPVPGMKRGVLLFGHTHVPEFTTHGEITAVNPGSVSIPKQGSPHSYLVLENGVFLWKTIENGEVYRREELKGDF